VLIASHIKPWNECDEFEKYDLYNGLLLSPNYDKLFDEYLISFDFEGKIMISNKLSDFDLKALGISKDDRILSEKLTLNHLSYLIEHNSIFNGEF
jgi:predicted restriction endonuclease